MKVPQVRTRSNVGQVTLRGARATASDFDAGLSGVAANIGEGLNEYALKEFQASNIAAVQEAESKLYEWENDSLYGDNGLYKRKGRDAMGASDELINGFNAYTQEVMATLTNEQQKNAFKQSVDSRRRDLMNTSSRYQFTELQNYKSQQSEAYIENSQIAAANHYQNPDRVNEEITRQVDSIRATANANGQAPELTKLQVESAVSTTHKTVIERALSNREYGRAKSYFERNKDRILPDVRDSLSKMITEGNAIQEAQSATDSIMNMGLNEKDSLAYARKNYSGKQRDQVVQRLKVRYAEQEQTKIFNDIEASQVAYNQILNGQDIDVVNASNLTDDVAKSLDEYKVALETGTPVVTSPENKSRLDFLYADHPSQFMNTNLLQYRSSLSDSDYNQYVQLQSDMIAKAKEAQRNGGKSFQPSSDFYTPKSYTSRVSKDFGIYDPDKPESKQTEYKAYYAKFADSVDFKLLEAQAAKGDKLTWDEEKKIIDNEAAFWKVNVSKSGLVFNQDDIFVGSLTEEELASGDYFVDVNGIPEEVSVKLTEYLIRNKIPPTEENVMEAFRLGKHL